ncbi:MAG: PQQ-dependent sugar dehydrogenase [Thermoflexales bacterium]|nr:PQQ-dependent sugar dehydrogenase [Thermoflexales bacterium]
MDRRWIVLVVIAMFVSGCAQSPTPRVTVSPVQPAAAAPTVRPPTIVPPTAAVEPEANTPAPTATIAPTEQAVSTSNEIALDSIATGLTRPVYLTHAGDARLFVIEQPGRIRIIENGQLLDRPFLDLVDRVTSDGNEQGLLSVAFEPDYASTGRFYVNYTRQPDGATVIERYTVAANDPNVAEASSATKILVIDQPEPNHNGGLIKFGPDGYLYVGMGDGGGAGDRHGSIGNGQDPAALLGKLLRLDVVNQATYIVPASNPFGNEIWALGVRNPWRFSFDRATGDLYIADVGQNQYEEVNFQLAASAGGENYGWRSMEGLHCFNPQSNCDQSGLVLPIAEYSHAEGCSITGGYVYRGAQHPALTGQYFFADYCLGTIWSLTQDAAGEWSRADRLAADMRISSFGEDVNGELYVIDHSGTLYRMITQ